MQVMSNNLNSIYYEAKVTAAYRSMSNSPDVEGTSESFSNYVGTGVRATTKSTVDDYLREHPGDKGQIDRLLQPGYKVMEQYGKPDAEVEEMSMDEYKKYIYGILDRIPYDSSQLGDTQFIDITEDGWKQMKNDPKYEAWVVGYFKVDRSVNIPFRNYPGVEPRIHTEHFGATIDEHIGQSYPESMATGKEKDSEDWWKKRHKRHEHYMELAKEAAERRDIQHDRYMHKLQETIFSKGSGNTYFDFESGPSPAAEFLMMMCGSGAGLSTK